MKVQPNHHPGSHPRQCDQFGHAGATAVQVVHWHGRLSACARRDALTLHEHRHVPMLSESAEAWERGNLGNRKIKCAPRGSRTTWERAAAGQKGVLLVVDGVWPLSIEKSRTLLGYAPAREPEDAILESVGWLIEHDKLYVENPLVVRQ